MPIKYIPFIPEPIEGQAVLGNFNRILKYKGADDVSMVLQRGMPLYEMEKQETVGDNTDGNLVIRGECVSACAYLKEQGIQVDLVYIDPPFASGADYAKQVYIRRNPKVAAAIAQTEQELDIDELRAFEEKMYGDFWDKEKYLNWMYENLTAIKSIMSDTASIFVHLDWHIVHYVKILLDEIFGEDNLVNEIVWQRTDPHNDAKNRLGRIHDTIFWYSYSEEYTYNWDAAIEPLSSAALKEYSLVKLPDGNVVSFQEEQHYPEGSRRFKLDDCTWKGQSAANKFDWRGATPSDKRVWPYNSPEEMDAAVARGEFYLRDPEKGACRCRVSYLDEREGQLLQTIWTECGRMKGGSTYPTEKPFNLLDRIERISSKGDSIIADFFGGSGVTAAVAAKLGRRFIHCDIGLNSIQTTRDRLKADGSAFDVLEIKDGVQLFRNPVQTMDKIKALIPGLKNEDSLTSFWEGAISDSKLGMVPVYVPNLMDSSSKLLDEVTMNRIIHQAIPELDNNVKKVIVYYIDITSEDEIRRFIREDDSTTVEIELRDLKAVLDDVVIGDYAEFHTDEMHEDLFGGWRVTVDKFLSDRVMTKIHEYNEKALLNAGKKGFQPIEISDEGLELIEYLSLDCTAAAGEWHSDSEIKIDKLGYVIRNGVKTKDFWDGAITSEKPPLRLKIRNICGDETEWAIL